MRFLRPEAASWLLMVPLALCVWYLHVFAKRRFRRELTEHDHLPPLSRMSGWLRDITALTAAVLAIGLLVAAMCRPQLLLQLRIPEYEKEDLILVLDRSISMRAQDVKPTRFARAVLEIKNFLATKPDTLDRVALVGFAGTSLVLTPLTRDMNNLFFYLDWIEQDTEPRFGTDIGNALANAREVIRKDTRDTRKVLLVVSDGDDQGEELARQLSELRAENIPVYTIGIGTDDDAEIPLVMEDGTITFIKGEDGRNLTTRFSETTLRNIATLTDGRYFRSITGSEVAPALRQAVQRERRVIAWKSSTEYRDIYRECLAAAALAAFVLLLAL